MLSKIYLNISFEQIGKFLDISAERAEAIISDMVTENRIKAQLDQLTSSVDFVVEMGGKGVQVAGGQGASADKKPD